MQILTLNAKFTRPVILDQNGSIGRTDEPALRTRAQPNLTETQKNNDHKNKLPGRVAVNPSTTTSQNPAKQEVT